MDFEFLFAYYTKVNEEHLDINIKPQFVIGGTLATSSLTHIF